MFLSEQIITITFNQLLNPLPRKCFSKNLLWTVQTKNECTYNASWKCNGNGMVFSIKGGELTEYLYTKKKMFTIALSVRS